MEKLVCDKCGIEYTDKESITMAKRYQEGWEEICRCDGVGPRGITPCPVIRYEGELVLEGAS